MYYSALSYNQTLRCVLSVEYMELKLAFDSMISLY